ncbi:hypothetical protein A0256_23540 [Mucilaginibacter sp. PAMC 26640]|nr:hypothetical protein A0256_23540 [Mucilaginibacter sp. PAMC 26640]
MKHNHNKSPFTLAGTAILFFLPFICLSRGIVKPSNTISSFTKTSLRYVPADSVTLVEELTEISLDTIQQNTLKRYTIKLKFLLKKNGGHHKDFLKVSLAFNPIVELAGLDFIPAADKIIINNTDWSKRGDTTVTKSIEVTLEQTKLVKTMQELVVSPVSPLFSGRHYVRFLPFESKIVSSKKTALVRNGGAEIIASGKIKNIERRYSTLVSSLDTFTVRLKFHGKYNADSSQLIFAFADSAIAKTFQIVDNPVNVTADEWRKGSEGTITVPLHIKTLKAGDTLNTVQNIDLFIRGQSQINRGSQRLKVIVPDKSFWAEVGTNFDLLDKIKTNNFYAGVFGHMKDVASIGKYKKNLSFIGGVYEAQSITQSQSLASGFTYRDGNSQSFDTTNNGFPIYSDTGRVIATTSVKSIGLLLSPQLQLTNGRLSEDGFHLSVSTYFEMLWQRITSTINYSKTARNQTQFVAANTRDTYPFKENSFEYDGRSHYFGAGLASYLKEDNYTLYINGIIGRSNQGFSITNPIRGGEYFPLPGVEPYYNKLLNAGIPVKSWNWFYVIQYRLTEATFGLTFSGEVRGLLIKGAKPVITLALSKKFDLSALLKPLVAPF